MVSIPAEWRGLSALERDVLVIAAYDPGMTNKAIAAALDAPEMTVSRACQSLRGQGLLNDERGPHGGYENKATEDGRELVEAAVTRSTSPDE